MKLPVVASMTTFSSWWTPVTGVWPDPCAPCLGPPMGPWLTPGPEKVTIQAGVFWYRSTKAPEGCRSPRTSSEKRPYCAETETPGSNWPFEAAAVCCRAAAMAWLWLTAGCAPLTAVNLMPKAARDTASSRVRIVLTACRWPDEAAATNPAPKWAPTEAAASSARMDTALSVMCLPTGIVASC